MLSIKIMAQDVFFCSVVEVGVEGFVNGKYARHEMLFAGFSPNTIFGQSTEPWIGDSYPRFYTQSIPYRTETSLANHVDFKTYEFGNGKISEKRNFEKSRFGNPAMRKEPGNDWFRIDIEMQRNDILQDILDAVDIGSRCSEDMVL